MTTNASAALPTPPVPLPMESSPPIGSVPSEVDVSSSLVPLQPWRDEFKRVQGELGEMSDSMSVAAETNTGAPVLRVTQLDAVIMDLELFEMLKAQFFKSFAFFKVRFPPFQPLKTPSSSLILTNSFSSTLCSRNSRINGHQS